MKISTSLWGDNYFALYWGRVPTQNASSMLKKLSLGTGSQDSWICVFNARNIAAPKHVFFALDQMAGLPRSRFIARVPSYELILRLSGQKQLSVALERLGVDKSPCPRIGIVAVAPTRSRTRSLLLDFLKETSIGPAKPPELSAARRKRLAELYGVSKSALHARADLAPNDAFLFALFEQIACIELAH